MEGTLCRRWARGAGTVAILLLAPPAMPHGESPPPPPAPTYPPRARLDHAYPMRWSWTHWWEANRDVYLESIRQGRSHQRPAADVVAGLRKTAVDALLKALDSEHWQVRASAALSLGRMEEASACGPLIELAKADRQEAVRVVALVALGLLDSDESRTFLLSHRFLIESEREAALVGVGLTERDSQAAIQILQKSLRARGEGRGTIAAWGLRRRTDPANAKLLGEIVRKSHSPWLVSEGLLTLGRQDPAEALKPLAEVVLETAWAKATAVHRALAAAHEERMKVASGSPIRPGPLDLWKSSPNRRPPKPLQRSRNREPMVGFERLYAARLRASAAVALGEVDHLASRRVLLKSLDGPDDAFTDLRKGMAILSVGRLGEPKSLPVLLRVLSPVAANGVRKPIGERTSPLRGYAAVALGLYGRPVQTPQGPSSRPDYAKVCQLLGERMADRKETMEVRSASAVALGLTARTENLRYLQRASRAVAAKDDPLVGYALLARGMLGDRNIVEPAARYLAVANDRTDMSGILGRRAAVLGLGLLGGGESVPVLRTAWDLNYYVSREVALAYSLLEAYNVTGSLAAVLAKHPKPLARAFAARCLGELFIARRPQRLALLTAGGNYMLRNDTLARYGALANEFLYAFLIAAFGDQWW